jgi:hypothetical protein
MSAASRGATTEIFPTARDKYPEHDDRPACPACRQPLDPAITHLGIHPTCEPLPCDPQAAASEVFGIIGTAIAAQPRNHQRRIGPSELGVPCARRVGYKLAGVDEVQDRGVAWKPYIGTSVHEQLGNVIARHELDAAAGGQAPRWHVEERISVGEVNGVEITGSCDLFDAMHGIVWDHKVTTRNKIRETYRPHGPGDQYRVQAHLYGRGWQRAGYAVRHVGIIFWTRDGEYADRHVWAEPYDEQIAIDALDRATSLSVALDALGPAFALPSFETASSYCSFCPWHDAKSTDLAAACPGHPTDPPAAPVSLAGALGLS